MSNMISLDPPSYSKFPSQVEGKTQVNKIKVTPASNVQAELHRARTAKEQKNRLYTVVCLLCIGVLVFGGGIALVVVGDSENIEDFIIVGGLFLGLGAVFLLVMALTLLKPIRDRKKIANKESLKSDSERKGYLDNQNTQIDSPEEVKRRPKPSTNQLYGYDKLKIHLPGPEVVPSPKKHKHKELPPPPPLVAFPSQGNTQNPVMISSLQREQTLHNSDDKIHKESTFKNGDDKITRAETPSPSRESGHDVVFY